MAGLIAALSGSGAAGGAAGGASAASVGSTAAEALLNSKMATDIASGAAIIPKVGAQGAGILAPNTATGLQTGAINPLATGFTPKTAVAAPNFTDQLLESLKKMSKNNVTKSFSKIPAPPLPSIQPQVLQRRRRRRF